MDSVVIHPASVAHSWAFNLFVSHRMVFVVLYTLFLGSFCCVCGQALAECMLGLGSCALLKLYIMFLFDRFQ